MDLSSGFAAVTFPEVIAMVIHREYCKIAFMGKIILLKFVLEITKTKPRIRFFLSIVLP